MEEVCGGFRGQRVDEPEVGGSRCCQYDRAGGADGWVFKPSTMGASETRWIGSRSVVSGGRSMRNDMERMKCSVRLVCAFGRIGVRFRLIEEWNEEGEGGEVGQWMALKFYMHLFQTAHPY